MPSHLLQMAKSRFIPVGTQDSQVLTLVTRHTDDSGYDTGSVHDVRFVIIGQFGFAGPA